MPVPITFRTFVIGSLNDNKRKALMFFFSIFHHPLSCLFAVTSSNNDAFVSIRRGVRRGARFL